MATFTELLAGITDLRERARLKAAIYADPAAYEVDFTPTYILKVTGWTVTVSPYFLDLNDCAVCFHLAITGPQGDVPLDNPFQIVNPPYMADGADNPTLAFANVIRNAAHDACVRAGFDPPF